MESAIGSSIPRLEDGSLLIGRGRFLDDISVPGALHVYFVRSTQAHAAIRSIKVDAAKAAPGVHAVLLISDLFAITGIERMPYGTGPNQAKSAVTPFILSNHEVAYVGESIAMIIADSRHLAEDAAALVEIDYEPLPAINDVRVALQEGATKVRLDLKTNVLNRMRVDYGDAAAAFSKAAHVFKEELWQHRGCGHPIETRGIIVEYRPDDTLNVWSSTQMPHDLFLNITEATHIPEERLRVVTPDLGGGFGPKLCIYPEEIAVATATLLLERSLKWVEDRHEHCLTAAQERDQYWSLEIAVDEDGHILGIRGNLIHDQGAYAFKAVNLPYNSATAVPGPYIVPHYDVEIIIAFTNKVPANSVRGAGYPQAAFAMERLMDRVARELKLDRAEIRRRNLIPPEKMPYSKPLKARSGAGITYDSGDYIASQAEVLQAVGWDAFPVRQQAMRASGRYIGIGLANAVKGTGRGPFETGIVKINPSGAISIYTGAIAMGQGLGTALAQICADQLGVRPDQIVVRAGDTALSPLGLGGFASRQLVTAGSSVLLSAKAVASKAKKLASHVLEVSEEDLELADGQVRVVGVPEMKVSLGELARTLRGAPGYAFPPGIEPALEADIKWQTEPLTYANTCHVAEVEVDPELCRVTILRYVALQDCGVLINPMIVTGQVLGGIAHGIGNALLEEMIYDSNCQPITTTFADYLLPTAPNIPRIELIYRQSPTPSNPLGAKGVGEVGTVPAAAAIISAVEDALEPFGVRIKQTPVTPFALFNLIQEARTAGRS